jgi:hypothetical protein
MMGLAAFSGQVDHVVRNARMVLSILAVLKTQPCRSRSAHFVWVLQVVNGVLTILKHSVAFSDSRTVGSGIAGELWNALHEILDQCHSLLISEDPDDIDAREHAFGSLKVAILWQLVDFHARLYWLSISSHSNRMGHLASLRNVLDQLIEMIPVVQKGWIEAENGSAITRSFSEFELFNFIYHIGKLIRNSLWPGDPIAAFNSALAVGRNSPLDADPFGKCIVELGHLFAIPILAHYKLRTSPGNETDTSCGPSE